MEMCGTSHSIKRLSVLFQYKGSFVNCNGTLNDGVLKALSFGGF